MGRVCRRGGYVAGEGLSWGGFVAGRVCLGWVCRGEGLSRGGFVWGGFVGVPVQPFLYLQIGICSVGHFPDEKLL